ncbi:13517_t:CDS:2 [Funneliformis mosseae]|uniref:13517_t:CDS:1 n=1 Tax=Funneliformis mosseae TaxID=27381 RepID=A0A9N9H549_FUNMO|nr:13517_t:CDS:2 [Funneliformis mosseae]
MNQMRDKNASFTINVLNGQSATLLIPKSPPGKSQYTKLYLKLNLDRSAFYDLIDRYAPKIGLYIILCVARSTLSVIILITKTYPRIIKAKRRHKIVNTYSANNKRLGQNKNLMPNSKYQEYNSDDQINSSVIEPEVISNINITKEIEPISIKRIEYTFLDEVDSITEINKTKNTKLQVKSASAKRVKRMSVSDDHNEVKKDTKSQVKLVSVKRVKRISVSDDNTELVTHNEIEKHILPHNIFS